MWKFWQFYFFISILFLTGFCLIIAYFVSPLIQYEKIELLNKLQNLKQNGKVTKGFFREEYHIFQDSFVKREYTFIIRNEKYSKTYTYFKKESLPRKDVEVIYLEKNPNINTVRIDEQIKKLKRQTQNIELLYLGLFFISLGIIILVLLDIVKKRKIDFYLPGESLAASEKE